MHYKHALGSLIGFIKEFEKYIWDSDAMIVNRNRQRNYKFVKHMLTGPYDSVLSRY